jgi:hypothetical protein
MIKNWSQFIKESQQLELFTDEGIFPYTEEDIMDFLLDLEDNGYSIGIRFGWFDSESRFSEKIESHYQEPCIGVSIDTTSKTKSENVTTSVTSFIKRVSKKAKAVKVYDDDGQVNIKNLVFNGAIFLNEKPEDSVPDEQGLYHDIEIEGGIWINIIFNKRHLTDKEILEYYGVGGKIRTKDGDFDALSYDEKGRPIFEVEVSELIDLLIGRRDDYVEYITNPDKMWDLYLGSFGYTPDHQSFFEYYLSNENIELLLKACIKLDGWEEIKEKLKDTNITQEEFIQSSRDRKSYDSLGKMISDLPSSGEVYDDLRRMYVDYEESAKVSEDLEEIISKFDEIVESQLETTIISKNKYEKKVIKTNKQGEKYEYNHEFETYKILFNFDWVQKLDEPNNLGSVYNILSEYCGNHLETSELKPNFSDYASVDKDDFNKEVKATLERILKKD